jgi:AraC-like DNA-binding protein
MNGQHTIDLYSLTLIIGAFQGAFFAVLLMLMNRQRRKINVHLSIILVAFGLQLFHQFLIESEYIYQMKPLVGFVLALDLFVGVALYWYLRNITHPELNNSPKKILLHYSIVIPGFLLAIPYWQLDFESKLTLITGGYAIDVWPEEVYYYLLTLFSLGGIVFVVYFYLCTKIFINHRRRIKNIFSYREKIALSWITNLFWLFGISIAFAMVFVAVIDNIGQSTKVLKYLGVFTTGFVIYIGIMGLMQPRIYHRSERSFVKQVEKNIEGTGNDDLVVVKKNELTGTNVEIDVIDQDVNPKRKDTGKYQKSALSESDMLRITSKLEQLMVTKKTYLEPDLTMPKLAAILNVSPNYLSQTINMQLKESFFDYVNRQRVDYAKVQLSDSTKINVSVLDIAMESAFNSKSAFYTAFKKHVGMTPVQFRLSAS